MYSDRVALYKGADSILGGGFGKDFLYAFWNVGFAFGNAVSCAPEAIYICCIRSAVVLAGFNSDDEFFFSIRLFLKDCTPFHFIFRIVWIHVLCYVADFGYLFYCSGKALGYALSFFRIIVVASCSMIEFPSGLDDFSMKFRVFHGITMCKYSFRGFFTRKTH